MPKISAPALTPATSANASRTLPPEDRFGYLDQKMTGSPWLFDPKRMPANPYHWFEEDAHVDGAAAAADLRALGGLLADAYGRYGQYQERHVDVPALLERHAQRVEQLDSPTALEAYVPAVADLRAALPDNHLIPSVDGAWRQLERSPRLKVEEFRGDAALLDAAAGVKGAFRNTAAVVPVIDAGVAQARTGSISAQGSDAADALQKLGYTPVSKSAPAVDLVPVPNEGAYSYREYGDVGILRVSSFGADGVAAAELQQLIEDAPLHRQKSKLVIDMRGNGGGNDGYMRDWIKRMLADTTPLPNPYSDAGGYASGKQGAVSAWNFGVWAGKYMGDDPLVQEWVKMGRATNASFGESAAIWLRDSLGATIVGERTAGYVEGTNVQTYRLPNTGFGILVPSRHATWKDRRVGEGVGIPVDAVLQSPGAPAEAVAQAIFGASSIPKAA